MNASSIRLHFLAWKNNQMHTLLVYTKSGFTSLPFFSVSANGTKALIAGSISGSISVDAFSFNFTSMSYRNFSLPAEANSNEVMLFAISDHFSFHTELIGNPTGTPSDQHAYFLSGGIHPRLIYSSNLSFPTSSWVKTIIREVNRSQAFLMTETTSIINGTTSVRIYSVELSASEVNYDHNS